MNNKGLDPLKIAYCCLLLPEEKKIAERSKRHLPGVSLHKFSKAIISGLDANLNEPIKIFNIINTLNYPKFPQLFFHSEKWSHTSHAEDFHIGYINLFGIKYITQEINLYFALDRWVRTLKGESFILCAHHIYMPMMKAVLGIKRKYKHQVITCLISGDLPGNYGLKAQYDTIKEKMIERMNEKILWLAKEFDTFVFQTPYMAEGFGVQDKPVCILECTYLPSAYTISEKASMYNKENKKVVFYAGSLRKEYGILHLLASFKYIEGNDYEFWLAGGGNTVDIIKQEAEKDNRIKYLGFISPQEVYDRQQVATVLVSPRKAELEYVKYSFPSKTMECLASGKPYIAHQLPCEPEEYHSYIFYPYDETDKALAETITSVCNMPEEERNEIGVRNKEFIENEKNPVVMCRRVIKLWEEQLKE